jgi:glycerol-3-phosphate acyltransferase PlsX
MLARPAFQRAKKVLDYTETGGAPLLGVDGVVFIGHGRSNAKAVKNGIGAAERAVSGKMLAAIAESLAEMGL